MFSTFKPAIMLFILLSVITGIAYPLAVFGIAQATFPRQANGSLLVRDGEIVGSRLIGQYFDDPSYFRGRPSVTSPTPYAAEASGGSNLGADNPALVAVVKQRLAVLRAADPAARGPVPGELVMASASGLDPDISPHAAYWQAPRVAKVRGLPLTQVNALIKNHIQHPSLGLFGESHVNVLALNMALDATRPVRGDNPRP